MKKMFILILVVAFISCPSFVYAEGGKPMPTNKPYQYSNPNNISTGSDLLGAKGVISPKNTSPIKNRASTNTPTYTMPDYQALYDAQLEATINALQKQRDSALSDLENSKSGIGSKYYDKRNQAGARSDIGALNFAQYMGSRGVSGNAGAMPEIYRNAALQGQIGALDQQEAQEYAGIESQKAQINSAYQNDVASARANTEAMALQSQIEQQRIDQAAALEQQRYDTQMKTQADVTAYNRLQDTKNEYANTVGRFGDNYQAEYDKVANDNDPSNDWQLAILAAARQGKIDDANKKYQQQGYVSEDIASALNLPVGSMTDAYKKQQQEAAAKQQVDNAMKMFAQLGYLTPEMVQILGAYGVSQDDITRMYRNQSTGGSSGGGNYGLSW
jgi:hypothetical protein